MTLEETLVVVLVVQPAVKVQSEFETFVLLIAVTGPFWSWTFTSWMANVPAPDQERAVPGTVERRRRVSALPQPAAPPSKEIVSALEMFPPKVSVADPPAARVPVVTVTLPLMIALPAKVAAAPPVLLTVRFW